MVPAADSEELTQRTFPCTVWEAERTFSTASVCVFLCSVPNQPCLGFVLFCFLYNKVTKALMMSSGFLTCSGVFSALTATLAVFQSTRWQSCLLHLHTLNIWGEGFRERWTQECEYFFLLLKECVCVWERGGERVCVSTGRFWRRRWVSVTSAFKETQVIPEGQNSWMEKDVQCWIAPSVWLDFTSHSQSTRDSQSLTNTHAHTHTRRPRNRRT